MDMAKVLIFKGFSYVITKTVLGCIYPQACDHVLLLALPQCDHILQIRFIRDHKTETTLTDILT